MIHSTIDLGTNTILMVTLDVADDGSVTVLGDEHEIARLGKGVDASRMILPETFDRVAGYLLRYREQARELGSERIIAFGTSALRDARNREEFIAAMRDRTGIAIELLSGEDEARYTFLGALFGLRLDAPRCVVIDIGGGSTEIAMGTAGGLERGVSIDIGAVRITERYLTTLPATPESIGEARKFIREKLDEGFTLPADIAAVGVAGTVTTLGAIAAGITHFSADALNGYALSADDIASITDCLAGMTVEQIAALPQVHPERADVLTGGALILDEFMRRHGLSHIAVSTRGVRYGVALRDRL